jgi:hypothetical protein
MHRTVVQVTRSPVATSKAGMLTKPLTDKRRKWYPVELLAQQAVRPVDQIVAWCESGKLKGFNSSSGWIVHRDQIEVWHQLCNTEPAVEEQVFRNLHQLFVAHPDLEPLWNACQAATWRKPYNAALHEAVKQDWKSALATRHITLQFSRPDIGFGAGFTVPDADEPGFQPIDRQRYGSAAEEQEADTQ